MTKERISEIAARHGFQISGESASPTHIFVQDDDHRARFTLLPLIDDLLSVAHNATLNLEGGRGVVRRQDDHYLLLDGETVTHLYGGPSPHWLALISDSPEVLSRWLSAGVDVRLVDDPRLMELHRRVLDRRRRWAARARSAKITRVACDRLTDLRTDVMVRGIKSGSSGLQVALVGRGHFNDRWYDQFDADDFITVHRRK